MTHRRVLGRLLLGLSLSGGLLGAESVRAEDEPRDVIVPRIVSVSLTEQKIAPPNLIVEVVGEVPTPGFENPRLSRAVYIVPPDDGIQDIFFHAVPPTGIVPQVVTEITASDTWEAFREEAPWIKGVRVHGVGKGVAVKMLADEGKTPSTNDATFRGTPDLVGAVQIGHNISPDRRAATIMFRNLEVSLNDLPPPPDGTPPRVQAMRLDAARHVDVRSATVSLPVASTGEEVHLLQDVRGSVEADDDTRVVVIVQSAGKTTVIDAKEIAEENGDFTHRIEATLPAGGFHQVTLTLMVERVAGDPPRGARLTFETLDLQIVDP